ncbi:MAG: hypothetical protein U1E02_18275, partial [Hydrogenophaga sp.]|nr:hypothetical protein [Hydrogenophaga sp.]
SPAAEAQLMERLLPLLGARCHELGETGPIGQSCQQVLALLTELSRATDHFSATAAQPEPVRRALSDLAPAALAEVAARLEAHHPGLHAWCAWRHAQASARSAGLAPLVDCKFGLVFAQIWICFCARRVVTLG